MKTTLRLSVGLLTLVLLGSGCTPTTPSATPDSPTPQAAQPTPVSSATATNCDHPYYPLALGTKATFATHTAGRNSTFNWEVTESTADHAKLTYHFGANLSLDSNISCTSDGLVLNSFVNMSSSLANADISAKTVSSTGQYLPPDLHIGSTWSNEFVVETTNNMPGAARLGMTTSHMTMTTSNEAVSEESVTVPAGTFTAIKVKSIAHSKMQLSPTMPTAITDTESYNYFVRGKGLVKSDTPHATYGTSSMEATSLTTP